MITEVLVAKIFIVFIAFGLLNLFVKAIYHDVFGHWPTFKEIWDYHQVDKDAET